MDMSNKIINDNFKYKLFRRCCDLKIIKNPNDGECSDIHNLVAKIKHFFEEETSLIKILTF